MILPLRHLTIPISYSSQSPILFHHFDVNIRETIPTPHFQPFLPDSWEFFSCHIPTDSLFQGKPLFNGIVPQNLFSEGNGTDRNCFHKIPFSAGLCFSKNSFQRNCFTGTISSEELFQQELFLKELFFEELYPQNPPCQGNQSVRCVGISTTHISKHRSKKPFPRPVFYSLNTNIKTRSSFQETVSKACFLFSKYQYQDTIIIPRNRFQGLFFHMSLIHISKPHTKVPI